MTKKTTKITVTITCVDKDKNSIITNLNSNFKKEYDDKTSGDSVGNGWTKTKLIDHIKELRKTCPVTVNTTLNEEVDIIEEKNGSKYLRTKGNKSTTDDLGDLKSCPVT